MTRRELARLEREERKRRKRWKRAAASVGTPRTDALHRRVAGSYGSRQ